METLREVSAERALSSDQIFTDDLRVLDFSYIVEENCGEAYSLFDNSNIITCSVLANFN